jgi:hypothetical protein
MSFLILLAATAAAFAVEAAPQRWAKAVPTGDFSVDRPVGWTAAEGPGDRLALLSIPCRPAGAALCDGQAEISVRWEPAATKATKAQACWSLAETMSEVEVSPGRRIETSQLSCPIGQRRFVIVERHWKGDKHTASYGRIAMQMAKSLRYPAKPPGQPPARPLFPKLHLP